MGKFKDIILEALDNCLVTDAEYDEMFRNKLTMQVKDDPFTSSVLEEDIQE